MNTLYFYPTPFIRTFGEQSGGGFTPPDIPDLELWLDASDEATVIRPGGFPANTVTQWNDKSSNGFNQTAYLIGGTAGPLYSLETNGDGINGLNAIQMNSYFFNNLLSDLITAAEGSIFVSYKFSAQPRVAASVDLNDSIVGAESSIGLNVNDSYQFSPFNDSGTLDSLAINSDIPPLSNIGTWVHGSGVLSGAVDMSSPATIASGNTVNLAANFTIGATQPGLGLDPANNFQGRIGEVLVYSRELTPTEIMQVQSYLFMKWKESIPLNAYTTPGAAEPYWDPNLEIYTEAT